MSESSRQKTSKQQQREKREDQWWITSGPSARILAGLAPGPTALLFQVRKVKAWPTGKARPRTTGPAALIHVRSLERVLPKTGGIYHLSGTTPDGKKVVAEYHPQPSGTLTLCVPTPT